MHLLSSSSVHSHLRLFTKESMFRCKKALNVTTQLKQPGWAHTLGFKKHSKVPYVPSMLNMLPCMKIPPSFHSFKVCINWDFHVNKYTAASAAYRHIPAYHFLPLYKQQPTVQLNVVLSVDGTPQVGRNILLTGLFMVTGILIRRVSKACVNSLTRIRP